MLRQKKYFLLLVLLFSGLAAHAARHTEQGGGFSYEVPNGWKVKAYKKQPFKILYTKPINGFAPNITFQVEVFKASLSSYMANNVNFLKTQSDVIIDSQGTGRTAEGINYLTLKIMRPIRKTKVVMISNVLALDNDIKFVITCASLLTDESRLQNTCTQLVDSLQFKK